MRTVVAVTDPLLAAGPKAETQSPTASALEATVCVVLTGVELDVVILSVSVFGVVGFLDLLLGLPRCVKVLGEIEVPDNVMVKPLTAVTLPEAMSRLANCWRTLPGGPPFGKLGRADPDPPAPVPVRNWNPPAGGPPDPVPKRNPFAPRPLEVPQAPVLSGIVKVMLRAEIVVFDFFDAEPVAVTQSPTAIAPTDSVMLFENVVVDVQFTVVWPLLGFWTSMLEVPSAATLPDAPVGALAVAAAPAAALEPTMPAARSAAAPVPRRRAQLRVGVWRSISVSMLVLTSLMWSWCKAGSGIELLVAQRVDGSE